MSKLQDFIKKYIYRNGNRFYKQIPEEKDKNRCFRVFYSEILEAIRASLNLSVKESSVRTMLTAINALMADIHRWDDLIDNENLPIKKARMLVFNTAKKKKQIALVKTIGIDYSQKELESTLKPIEQYFQDEQNILQQKPTSETVGSMLSRGNCDFTLYNRLFYSYISGKLARKDQKILGLLDNFLAEYSQLDLLLDHITDLEEDFQKRNFNTLLWTFWKNNDKIKAESDIYRQLVKEEILEKFYQIGKKIGKKAKKSLRVLWDYQPLYNLLKFYLEGEITGLKLLRENNYFIYLPKTKRQIYLLALLKPHPWERLLRKEITQCL